MIEDPGKIVNEVPKDKARMNLMISSQAGSGSLLIAQRITDRLRAEKQESLF
jgi:hypothetical protein